MALSWVWENNGWEQHSCQEYLVLWDTGSVLDADTLGGLYTVTFCSFVRGLGVR